MQHSIKHSQTPKFDSNKSCTTAILFQSPTAQEQRPSFWAIFTVNIGQTVFFGFFLALAWFLITTILTTVFGA